MGSIFNWISSIPFSCREPQFLGPRLLQKVCFYGTKDPRGRSNKRPELWTKKTFPSVRHFWYLPVTFFLEVFIFILFTQYTASASSIWRSGSRISISICFKVLTWMACHWTWRYVHMATNKMSVSRTIYPTAQAACAKIVQLVRSLLLNQEVPGSIQSVVEG